jgi:WD40 repeat protein
VLYTGGYDGRLIYWPSAADKPEPLRVIDAHRGWLRAIAVSPDGKYLATCGNDLLVKLWDATAGTLVKEFKGHKSHVYNVAFSQDSSSLVSCDLKGVVNAWTFDAEAPRELATVEALHKYDTTFRADIGGARDVALRADGAQLALGGITNVTNAFAGVGEIAIALVNLAEAKLDLVLETKDKTKGAAWGVAHHPDGFWIGLSGGGGGWLYFWKGDTKHEFFKLKLKNDGRGMSISPNRTQLAVAHADKHLRIYNLFAA